METLFLSPSGHFYIHYDTSGTHAPDLNSIDGDNIPDRYGYDDNDNGEIDRYEEA